MTLWVGERRGEKKQKGRRHTEYLRGKNQAKKGIKRKLQAPKKRKRWSMSDIQYMSDWGFLE